MIGFGFFPVPSSYIEGEQARVVFLARGAPKPCPQLLKSGAFPGHKNSWFSLRKHLPFHWPKTQPNRRGTRVPPTSTMTFRFKVRRLFASTLALV
jgi:hypothetical protein